MLGLCYNENDFNLTEPFMLQDDDTTHFGFSTVKKSDKARNVHKIFTDVANRYDIMNDVMSIGMHRLWKNALINWLSPSSDGHLLDVAGGTGDIASRFLTRTGKSGRATIVDINFDMMKIGREKLQADFNEHLDWIVGDGEALPIKNGAIDYVTIAFGMRNITNIELALKDMYRVLKPGGRLICLEFSKVIIPGLDFIYDKYSFNVIPHLGQLITGNEAAYRYLVESIRRFPDQNALALMFENAGFKQVAVRNLNGGIVAMHSAWRTA